MSVSLPKTFSSWSKVLTVRSEWNAWLAPVEFDLGLINSLTPNQEKKYMYKHAQVDSLLHHQL